MKNIIIATIKSWNIHNAETFKKRFNDLYNVTIIDNKDLFTLDNIKKINPDYIFFPHWSWIVKEEIYLNYNCIVFHMTDLPYGRGGSPLQNLIVRKLYDTKISAIRVQKDLDAGPVFLKEDFNIAKGSADDILKQISSVVFEKMIPIILKDNIIPAEQKGEITIFNRRTPKESNLLIAQIKDLNDFYDFVRMLDGEGYPKSFIKLGDLKIDFSKVTKENNKLIGSFEVYYE